jgi:hypothetical protein
MRTFTRALAAGEPHIFDSTEPHQGYRLQERDQSSPARIPWEYAGTAEL